MSLAASQARLIYLARYASDLQYGVQMIVQQRQQLAAQAQIASQGQNSQAFDMFHYKDKQLEMEGETLKTQLNIAEKDYESVKKHVDNGVKTMQYA